MRFLPVLLGAAFISLSVQTVCAEPGSSVVATVNGVNLTRAELNQEAAKILPMEQNYHGGISQEKLKNVENKAMAVLVEMELQYQDALSKGVKLDKKALALEEEKLAVKFPTHEAYLEAVKAAGFTEQSMARFVERNVLAPKIRAMEVEQKLKVTDEQVLRYYEENRSKYQKPEEYRARLILVKVDPSSNTEQRAAFKKKAEEVLQSIEKGADFGDVAFKRSDDTSRIKGGDLGSLHFGQMEEEFEALIKKMKPGEVSSLQENLKGFYIVKLEEKKPPRQIPFEEAREKVRNNLTKQEKDRLFNTWMDGLRAKAKIVYATPEKIDKGKPN
jgi:parvulin-like peptidyl-prolyl isomerase